MRLNRLGTGLRVLVASVLVALAASAPAAAQTELFFSEYIEGSSNNKALEIYNGTGVAIDLGASGYNVQMFFNGSATAGLTINLMGTVANGDVFVLAQSSANATILAQADQTNGAGWFNGDDAVVLRKGGASGFIVDVIGQIGFDPGTEWGTGLTSTADNTLRRKSAVCAGDINGTDVFDPLIQWDGFATDTFAGLGSHAVECAATDTAPSVTSTYPGHGATDFPVDGNLTVTFSEPVNVSENWFSLVCTVSGAKTATVSDGPTRFTIDPDTVLAYGDTCTLTVRASQVTDQDANDPPDNMTADFVASFATAATDPCTASYTPIYDIQGSGATVALTGTRITQGVVVGDYEGASPGLRGFFIQDPAGDGNPATSDGIFVFDGSNQNRVSVGQVVRVTGTAGENQGQSQISLPVGSSIIECGTGTVTPVDVTFPVPSPTHLEQFEGMLVRLPQTLYVTEHFQLGRFGQVVLSSGARLQQPTDIVAPGEPALALQADNNLNRIILDDALQNQNPDPILFARGGLPLSASNTLRGGDTATGIVGVMTYTWAGNAASGNAYRVRPIGALDGAAQFVPVNERPTEAPDVGGNLRVASANLLNYFNTFTGCFNGVGGAATDCRGADTQAEFDRQVGKTVAALLATGGDVLGLVEFENDGYGPDSAIHDLVTRLNDVAGAGTWAFIDVDAATSQSNALGTDAIKVGILYKPAKVTPVGTTAALNSIGFVNGGDGAPRNRPSLAQAFETPTRDRFVLVVNHLKSKGSACDLPDQGDGQGNCNAVRLNAATELAHWLATDPTNTGAPALLVGDFNAYSKEEPIAELKTAGFVDTIERPFGVDVYSYVFDGQWGSLDHALASPGLMPRVAGAGIYHINADEPSALDYNTDFKTPNLQNVLYASDEFRAADHDPLVVGLDFTYNFTGFFPPVANAPAVNARKAGSAVPVKFSLGGDQGLAIFASGYPVSLQVGCQDGKPVSGAMDTATANPGNSGLAYDPGADQYTYVWKTDKSWAGTCRLLSVTLVDGNTHTAFFSFR